MVVGKDPGNVFRGLKLTGATVPGNGRLGFLPCGPRVSGQLFEIPETVTYLNCASMAPQLRSITQSGISAVQARATAWKLSGPEWFSGAEQLRMLAAELLGTTSDGSGPGAVRELWNRDGRGKLAALNAADDAKSNWQLTRRGRGLSSDNIIGLGSAVPPCRAHGS
jgi:hypothetical protein